MPDKYQKIAERITYSVKNFGCDGVDIAAILREELKPLAEKGLAAMLFFEPDDPHNGVNEPTCPLCQFRAALKPYLEEV